MYTMPYPYYISKESSNRKVNPCFASRGQSTDGERDHTDDIDIRNWDTNDLERKISSQTLNKSSDNT